MEPAPFVGMPGICIGAMDGAGDGDPIFIPGIEGAGLGAGALLGAAVIPGIGAIVAEGEGLGLGRGVALLGAAVGIGIPGMGPMVGWAAEAAPDAASARRVVASMRTASKRSLSSVVVYYGT